MIGPATNARVEVGLNMKDVPGYAGACIELPPGGSRSSQIRTLSVHRIGRKLGTVSPEEVAQV